MPNRLRNMSSISSSLMQKKDSALNVLYTVCVFSLPTPSLVYILCIFHIKYYLEYYHSGYLEVTQTNGNSHLVALPTAPRTIKFEYDTFSIMDIFCMAWINFITAYLMITTWRAATYNHEPEKNAVRTILDNVRSSLTDPLCCIVS